MNNKLIKAPATCKKCRTQMISPTTGLVWNECPFCGGQLESDPPHVMVNGFPRRCRIDLFTPAEKAIYDAVQAVEAAGADPLLTDAVTLLDQARNKVADFVERRRQVTQTNPDQN